MRLEQQYTGDLGRAVFLRPNTSDRQVWADTFTGRYHIPPPPSPVNPAPTTVLDLGANIGLTCAHYKRMWPNATVYGIEPDWGSFEVATKNAPDCVLQRLAVASWDGDGWYDPNARAEAIQVLEVPREGYERVDCFQLQSWLNIHEPIDFVKMDVEGMEWELFDVGESWAPSVPRLLVELHGDAESEAQGGSAYLVEQAVSKLEGLGYEARHHPPHPQAVYARKP